MDLSDTVSQTIRLVTSISAFITLGLNLRQHWQVRHILTERGRGVVMSLSLFLLAVGVGSFERFRSHTPAGFGAMCALVATYMLLIVLIRYDSTTEQDMESLENPKKK